MQVSDILRSKDSRVLTIKPDATIQTLSHRLRTEKVGAFIVSRDGKSLDGIISERDVAHGVAAHGAGLSQLPVSDLMTHTVFTCAPEDTIAEVMQVMTHRRIRHLPVKRGDEVIGVVSIGDILKHRIEEARLEANIMRDYAIARR